MKFKLEIVAFSFVLLVTSCDTFTDVEYYGSNKTDKVLLIKMFTNNNKDSTMIELNPNDIEKQVSVRGGVAKGTNGFNCCPCYYQLIKVEVKDQSKMVTKNPTIKDSWTNKVKKGDFTKTADKINCFLEINQTDLQ